jgi:hypothetical protein
VWRDQVAFGEWMSSAAFGRAHGHESAASGEGASSGGHPGGAPPPVGTASEVWAFTVEQRSAAGS